jgi:hypothetical protein
MTLPAWPSGRSLILWVMGPNRTWLLIAGALLLAACSESVLRGPSDLRSDHATGDSTPADGPTRERATTDGGACSPVCAGKCAGAPDGCNGTCATSQCTGCCDATTKVCSSGTLQSACGKNGGACSTCRVGETCAGGACGIQTTGPTFYVATSGDDGNPGTITKPWKTWQKGFSSLVAGDTLYIRGGTYTDYLGEYKGTYYGVRVGGGHDGTPAKHITVSAYPGETPVLDCSGASLKDFDGPHDGLLLDSVHYWDLVGLTVANVREYGDLHASAGGHAVSGLSLADSSYITLTSCTVRGCGNGFALGGCNDYIYYKNCDAYENYDYIDSGGLANGFNTNICSTDHVSYEGCRAWLNSDDGFDAFSATAGSGYISYDGCWAFQNGAFSGKIGNGAGFKTGLSVANPQGGIQRTLKNCIAADNLGIGFDESQDPNTGEKSIPHAIYNGVSFNNGSGFNFGYGGGQIDIIRNCISHKDKALGSFGTNTVDHNSWNGAVNLSDADFVSVDSSQLLWKRKADGSLPDMTFLHLVPGSDLIDKGVDVGLTFHGTAPDLGAFETP